MHLADLAIKCGCHSVCTAVDKLQSPWWDVSLNSLLACLLLTFFHMKHLHASKLNPKIQGEDSHSFNYLPNPACFLLLGQNNGIQNLQKTSQTEDSNTVFRGMEVIFPAEFQIIPYYCRFPTAPAKNACV